jgi:hypothetical protein
MDPVNIQIPENYLKYLQQLDRRSDNCGRQFLPTVNSDGFNEIKAQYRDQRDVLSGKDRFLLECDIMAKLGLLGDQGYIDINADYSKAGTADGPGNAGLDIEGPEVVRRLENKDPSTRQIGPSPLKLNLESGEIENLAPDRVLEAIGRMPSDLILGGKLFVIDRSWAPSQLEDFRVHIGDPDNLESYPADADRSQRGDLRVKVHGIGIFTFPFEPERYMIEGIFTEYGTNHRTEFPKAFRPEGDDPRTQWPHLRHSIRNIEMD